MSAMAAIKGPSMPALAIPAVVGSAVLTPRSVASGRPAPASPRGASPRGASPRGARRARELQDLVHDFRTSATTGILVHLIDPDSALVSQAIFFIDKMIEKVTLMVAFTCARSFDPRDVVSVVKGDEFGRRVPSLESQRSNCVGVEVQGSGGELVCFHFPEPASADDFHACMKVLCKTLRNVPPLGTPRSTNRPSPRRLSPRDEPAAGSGRMRFVQARAA